MADLNIVQPQDNAIINLIRTNNDKHSYSFAIGGHIGSQTPNDWDNYVPIYATLKQTAPVAKVGIKKIHSSVFHAPFDPTPQGGPNRKPHLPWGIQISFNGRDVDDMTQDASARYEIVVYYFDADANVVQQKPAKTGLRFQQKPPRISSQVTNGNVNSALSQILAEIARNPNNLSQELVKAMEGLLFGTVRIVSIDCSFPTTQASPSFTAYGAFGPYDTAILRVEVIRGTTIIAVNNTPYSGPMGYWAASFSNVPVSPGNPPSADTYLNIVGNSTTKIIGPIVIA